MPRVAMKSNRRGVFADVANERFLLPSSKNARCGVPSEGGESTMLFDENPRDDWRIVEMTEGGSTWRSMFLVRGVATRATVTMSEDSPTAACNVEFDGADLEAISRKEARIIHGIVMKRVQAFVNAFMSMDFEITLSDEM